MSTPWPLVWTVDPTSEEASWEGTRGDALFFTVSAIPDPDFDDSGNYPPPTDIAIEVVSSDIDPKYFTINGATFSVMVDDVSVFLPFESIRFEKDGAQFEVFYEEDLYEQGFDFVYAFIPSDSAQESKGITLRATSTSTTVLEGTFNLVINNDFDAIRKSLEAIVAQGEEFLGSLESGDGTAEKFIESANNKETIYTPTFESSYQYMPREERFLLPPETPYDTVSREGTQEEIEDAFGDGSSLNNRDDEQDENIIEDDVVDVPEKDEYDEWLENGDRDPIVIYPDSPLDDQITTDIPMDLIDEWIKRFNERNKGK